MSKTYTTYGKGSRPIDITNQKPSLFEETRVPEVEESVAVSTEETAMEEPVEDLKTPAPTHGFVSGCKKLRVRSSADSNSKINILCEIAEKEKVEIVDTLASWYKIRTKADVEGFCMSKYITLIQ